MAARFRDLRAANATEAVCVHAPREPGSEHLGDERHGLSNLRAFATTEGDGVTNAMLGGLIHTASAAVRCVGAFHS
jgi:hypothetical protein